MQTHCHKQLCLLPREDSSSAAREAQERRQWKGSALPSGLFRNRAGEPVGATEARTAVMVSAGIQGCYEPAWGGSRQSKKKNTKEERESLFHFQNVEVSLLKFPCLTESLGELTMIGKELESWKYLRTGSWMRTSDSQLPCRVCRKKSCRCI